MPNPQPLRPGDPEAIAAYRIVGRLGEGGQGIVYLGQAPGGRPVAVKVLRESAGGDDRFAREIAAAGRVEPFCVAQVLDASAGGRPYIVSEYVEGPSLQEQGRHYGADLQRLAVSTATALAAIHQAGVVHRDFKPANVLLGRDGPRVIDFGIARAADSAVTVTSSVVGTPAYMAPEQLAGAYVGPATDVFAWGAVIVFAATGTPPFGEDSLPAVINRILNQEPFLGELPEPLRSIVYACLAKDPAARPHMRDVLMRLIGGPQAVPPGGHQAMTPGDARVTAPGGAPSGPAAMGPGAPSPMAVPPRRRLRVPLAAGVSGLVAVCLAAGVVVWNGTRDRPPAGSALAAGVQETSPSAGVQETSPTATASSARRKKTAKPTTSPTPSVTRKATRPTPSPRRTTARPTPTRTPSPTKKPATKAPEPTPAKTKAKAASFDLAYVRVAGKSKINQEGVTCYSGAVTFGVGIGASEMGAPFSYQWLVDGQVFESGSRRIPSYGRDDYFGSKREFAAELGSTHTVTFQLTSPRRKAKSASWTMC